MKKTISFFLISVFCLLTAGLSFAGSVTIDGRMVDANVIITTLSAAPIPTPPPTPPPIPIPPPTPPPPSPSGLISLNQPIGSSGFFGYNGLPQYGGQWFRVEKGRTYLFIIDPAVAGKTGRPLVDAGDWTQTMPSTVVMWTLDASGNKVTKIPFSGGNAMYNPMWPKIPGVWVEGQRCLVSVTSAEDIPFYAIFW